MKAERSLGDLWHLPDSAEFDIRIETPGQGKSSELLHIKAFIDVDLLAPFVEHDEQRFAVFDCAGMDALVFAQILEALPAFDSSENEVGIDCKQI